MNTTSMHLSVVNLECCVAVGTKKGYVRFSLSIPTALSWRTLQLILTPGYGALCSQLSFVPNINSMFCQTFSNKTKLHNTSKCKRFVANRDIDSIANGICR